LLSPYKRTVWLDLDTQVRGSIEPLFAFCENEGGFAAAPEHVSSQLLNKQRKMIGEDQVIYNAGVLVFKRQSKVVQEWIDRSKDQNHLHCSDQQILALVLNSKLFDFTTLSRLFNWTIDVPAPSEVVILHWWGGYGKNCLRNMLTFLEKDMLFNLSFKDPL
jgi:lipopolysaccharide biosynthesis glycosyltransferase